MGISLAKQGKFSGLSLATDRINNSQTTIGNNLTRNASVKCTKEQPEIKARNWDHLKGEEMVGLFLEEQIKLAQS